MDIKMFKPTKIGTREETIYEKKNIFIVTGSNFDW